MRTIKFRAWDKNSSSMIYSGDCEENGDLFWSGSYKLPKMQFTGLLDKNGKEIYEGDIVRVLAIDLEDTDPKTGKFGRIICDEIAEIKWKNIGWGFWIKYSMWLYDGYRNLEVLGNIMENPELLTNN